MDGKFHQSRDGDLLENSQEDVECLNRLEIEIKINPTYVLQLYFFQKMNDRKKNHAP